MIRFDLDTQRAAACMVGLMALALEGLAYSLFGVKPSEILTGAFVTLAIGPVITGTIEKIRSQPPPGGRRETDDVPAEDDAEATELPRFMLALRPAV